MRKWLKSLSKDSIQRIVFFGVLALLFGAFFISLQFVSNEGNGQVNNPNENEGDTNNPNETPGETPKEKEKFCAPTTSTYKILTTYFDETLNDDDLEKAVMKYEDGKFICSLGLSLGLEDDSSFDVVACLSGVVASVSKDSLYGNVVTVTHENGYTSEYSCLSEVSVKVGDAVSQGTSLGKSGSSLLNPSENHVYFIVRKDSKTINPLNVFGKTLEELNG